jgi:hypothetical protein
VSDEKQHRLNRTLIIRKRNKLTETAMCRRPETSLEVVVLANDSLMAWGGFTFNSRIDLQ